MKNRSKKITNKRINKKRFSKYSRGGRQSDPKWKMYGYRSEDDYLNDRQEQIRRERLEREVQKVLINPIIQSIMMIIMNDDQARRFETHIRANIRIEGNVQSYNQMIREFVNHALELLDDQQRVLTRRIMDAIQQERTERASMNQPFGRLQMVDVIERVVRENIEGRGGGKKKYYKRHTTVKNTLNSL